jgi:thioredoxin 1
MATVALTKDNFEETVTGNGIVLVDWWADWCGPCKMFAPTFEAASEKHDDVVFGKIDTEDQRELSEEAGIQSIPTLMAFRDGILLYSQPGALPPAALEEIIGKVKELDMDAVRAEIEKEEAEDHSGHNH